MRFVLRGYDMDGWTWAVESDVQSLFNHYLHNAGYSGDDLLSGTLDGFYDAQDSTWADTVIADGFSTLGFHLPDNHFRLMKGWTASEPPEGLGITVGFLNTIDGSSFSDSDNITTD